MVQIGTFGAQTDVGVPSGERLDVLNASSAAVTVTLAAPNGQSVSFALAAGQAFGALGTNVGNVSIPAVNANVVWALVPSTSPPFFGAGVATAPTVVVTPNPLPALVGQAGGGASPNLSLTTDSEGRALVRIVDFQYNPIYVPYTGGVAAPVTGVWTVAIKAASNTAPTINGNVLAGPSGETTFVTGTVYVFRYPVTDGTTYTVANGTVVDGVVT